jgi:hypothetical protein
MKTIKEKVKIYNMESYSGNKVPNQFELYTNKGRYFQSYNSVITFPQQQRTSIFR